MWACQIYALNIEHWLFERNALIASWCQKFRNEICISYQDFHVELLSQLKIKHSSFILLFTDGCKSRNENWVLTITNSLSYSEFECEYNLRCPEQRGSRPGPDDIQQWTPECQSCSYKNEVKDAISINLGPGVRHRPVDWQLQHIAWSPLRPNPIVVWSQPPYRGSERKCIKPIYTTLLW